MLRCGIIPLGHFIGQWRKVAIFCHALTSKNNNRRTSCRFMKDNEQELMRCFWLPPNYNNNCVSGASAKTLERRGKSDEDMYAILYFDRVTLPQLMAERHYVGKLDVARSDPSWQIIRDAVADINGGFAGYVFSVEQLRRLLNSVSGDVTVKKERGIYYVRKTRK